ncbi:hypothetical protein CBS101457_006904 [Exobasidium rhododendri]|nr:hypothetical protein CBS101457_006904 [Exobasidium rhododendri]
MGLKQDFVAALGEFVGTTLFLLLALGGAKTAQVTRTTSQTQGLSTSLGNQTIMFIALSFGMSLLVTAWVFYRVTGGLFNPAITLALWLIGGLSAFRAVLLVVSQLLGGIAAAALVAALTPFGGAEMVETNLGTGVNVAQGLFIEAFLTAILVLTVILLAAEKHKSTYLAPVGIGLALLACHMFGVVWTGCGINPARSFGPSVVSGSFPGYHWIYWVGPGLGSCFAVGFYVFLKLFDYTSVVFGQDADHEVTEEEQKKAEVEKEKPKRKGFFRRNKGKVVVFHPVEDSNGVMEEEGKVVSFDPANKGQDKAVREGDAVVVDLTRASYAEDRMETGRSGGGGGGAGADAGGEGDTDASGKFVNGVPSMKAQAQDVGGLLAPGTSRAM